MSGSSANKQKLDELLGIVSEMEKHEQLKSHSISPKTTIPNDIPGTSVDSLQTLQPTPATIIPLTPQEMIQKQDCELERMDEMEVSETKKSLSEIDYLVEVSKRVIDHVYSAVSSSDILDAQTIAACAKLINETKGLVQEHLEIQKSQRDFLNKIQMEEIKHRHQMELMEKKFELDRKRFQAQHPAVPTSGAANIGPATSGSSSKEGGNGLKSYSSADMMRMLNEEG